MKNWTGIANFIFSVAELLRGDFKQSEYGKVILPFTVLRRFDCVLAPSKAKILEMNKSITVSNKAPIFKRHTKQDFYNTSKFDFAKLLDDSNAIETNLRDYINGFSDDVKAILDNFETGATIDRLKKAKLLYIIIQKFSELNLDEKTVDNLAMGYVFEELIRKFSEQSNETAGEHFTPREVIELMVKLLLEDERDLLTTDGKVVKVYDPACGTGGMLAIAQQQLAALNNKIEVIPFGQELNPETYATCKSDMIIKGSTQAKIEFGNSFSEDKLPSEKFDYMLSNPPFGVEWKKVQDFVENEADKQGFNGRFGAGLPRISDGSLLFLQHMISKMIPKDKGGSRIAIVFNGSPLFSGDAGSGESNIRKWIIENDMLEAIIGLPSELFYNTPIATYIWIVTNRKNKRRKGKIRLVNAVSYFEKMRKSLGNKRNEINKQNIDEIVKLYSMHKPHESYIDFDNEDFGYNKITVERPLYDSKGKIELDKKGKKKANTELRDSETVTLKENILDFFKKEVLPYVSDAWIDESKTKIGYEIPFNRYFFKLTSLRKSEQIQKEIKLLEKSISKALDEVVR
ncbi:MAG: type I restriction-modification system subunit M [Endomicrobia bacterium]|nr:type I restriction-modification system subunit M [Endomicrobiia bacterium]MCL2506173.1 type I restriction-modification system subunit M [Endomicrobiia bacterium]